jgi:hypothetical protein
LHGALAADVLDGREGRAVVEAAGSNVEEAVDCTGFELSVPTNGTSPTVVTTPSSEGNRPRTASSTSIVLTFRELLSRTSSTPTLDSWGWLPTEV